MRSRHSRAYETRGNVRERDNQADRQKTDAHALTFSFALPACFCTVFAINAPLLSAMMLPVTSVAECKSPERKKPAKHLNSLNSRLAALRRGGEVAAHRLERTKLHVPKRGETLRARRRADPCVAGGHLGACAMAVRRRYMCAHFKHLYSNNYVLQFTKILN